MKKIGVIGMGVVGTALYRVFEETNLKSLTSFIYAYDKYKEEYPFDAEAIQTLDEIFLCLPTPTEYYEQDTSAIYEALNIIAPLNKEATYVLKSTVLPGTTDELHAKFGIKIVHSPEFLSELSAYEDMKYSHLVFIGVPDALKGKVEITKTMTQATPYKVLSAKATEMIKYTANCFYATKVTFFNSIYQVCQNMGIQDEYDDIRFGAIKSKGWIREMHTTVPGRHGFGYSGMCFPKDMKAFSIINPLMGVIDVYNEKIRKENNQ